MTRFLANFLSWVFTIAGLLLGLTFGLMHHGIVGGACCALLGACLGFALARAPEFLLEG